MRRRDFLSLVGGAFAAWPLSARAQQSGKLPVIGFLFASTAAVEHTRRVAFVQRLGELGWVEGRSVVPLTRCMFAVMPSPSPTELASRPPRWPLACRR